jgi:hypothetical protein
MRKLIVGLALAGLVAMPALAQDGYSGEVNVTGSRANTFDAAVTPHVVLRRRADNLILEVTVICDTRDPVQRREELKATLRNMIRAAGRDAGIELGVGDKVIVPFDETMLDSVIGSASKVDTSSARIQIKTPLGADDSFDRASARIAAFIKSTPKDGRTEILGGNQWNLTLVKPEQYRGEIIALIAKDALGSASAFGDGYGVSVGGLNLPVTWYRSGPLELALYIPYRLEIQPK